MNSKLQAAISIIRSVLEDKKLHPVTKFYLNEAIKYLERSFE